MACCLPKRRHTLFRSLAVSADWPVDLGILQGIRFSDHSFVSVSESRPQHLVKYVHHDICANEFRLMRDMKATQQLVWDRFRRLVEVDASKSEQGE